MFKIRPLFDQVFVEPMKQENKTKGGIVLPETAEKERPFQGRVVAVGPGKLNDKGEHVKPTVKEGDIVIFTKYTPNEIKIDDKEYLVIKEDEILGIINQSQ